MIISWRCGQCGWMNDNNLNGDCRRCGGNTEFHGKKELITKKSDKAKIESFDALLKAQRSASEPGAKYDRR